MHQYLFLDAPFPFQLLCGGTFEDMFAPFLTRVPVTDLFHARIGQFLQSCMDSTQGQMLCFNLVSQSVRECATVGGGGCCCCWLLLQTLLQCLRLSSLLVQGIDLLLDLQCPCFQFVQVLPVIR